MQSRRASSPYPYPTPQTNLVLALTHPAHARADLAALKLGGGDKGREREREGQGGVREVLKVRAAGRVPGAPPCTKRACMCGCGHVRACAGTGWRSRREGPEGGARWGPPPSSHPSLPPSSGGGLSPLDRLPPLPHVLSHVLYSIIFTLPSRPRSCAATPPTACPPSCCDRYCPSTPYPHAPTRRPTTRHGPGGGPEGGGLWRRTSYTPPSIYLSYPILHLPTTLHQMHITSTLNMPHTTTCHHHQMPPNHHQMHMHTHARACASAWIPKGPPP
jgi:hypothetical protein